MNDRRILNHKQREWAYQKYCEGYTQSEIAEALYVSTKTVLRAIHGRPRIKAALEYDWSDNG